MQNYNNYGNGNFRNINNAQNVIPRNNAWNAGGYNGLGYQTDNYSMNNMGNYQANNYNQPQQQPQAQADDRVFVAGRLGADTYQLQPGVNVQILWDDEVDRFYIKGYDNKGRPRVIGDFDFFPHVDNDTPQTNTDMSMYATKDDIDSLKNWLNSAINNANKKNGKYVTMDEFNKVLSGLSVGSGGRIVRENEPDA